MSNKPVKHYHQHTASRGEGLQPLLGERIGLQFSVLERPDHVLVLLIIAVQDGQVKIGRRLVDIWVPVVSLENIFLSSARGPNSARETNHE